MTGMSHDTEAQIKFKDAVVAFVCLAAAFCLMGAALVARALVARSNRHKARSNRS